MTLPAIEPRSPGPLANTLLIRSMTRSRSWKIRVVFHINQFTTSYPYNLSIIESVLEQVGNWLLTIGYRLPCLLSWQTKARSSLKNLSFFLLLSGGFYALKKKKLHKPLPQILVARGPCNIKLRYQNGEIFSFFLLRAHFATLGELSSFPFHTPLWSPRWFTLHSRTTKQAGVILFLIFLPVEIGFHTAATQCSHHSLKVSELI